ncbi:MAG: hypothetical protein WDN50_05965 [Bradyrhizobium sp.]
MLRFGDYRGKPCLLPYVSETPSKFAVRRAGIKFAARGGANRLLAHPSYRHYCGKRKLTRTSRRINSPQALSVLIESEPGSILLF